MEGLPTFQKYALTLIQQKESSENLPFLFPKLTARLRAVYPSLFVAVMSAPCSTKETMYKGRKNATIDHAK